MLLLLCQTFMFCFGYELAVFEPKQDFEPTSRVVAVYATLCITRPYVYLHFSMVSQRSDGTGRRDRKHNVIEVYILH